MDDHTKDGNPTPGGLAGSGAGEQSGRDSAHYPSVPTPMQLALGYAADDIRVFPCGPDKKPRTTNGYLDATTDAGQIASWWTRHPDALIGLATGLVNDVVVIDVDIDVECGKNGEKSLAGLVAQYGPLPHTAQVRTPRGGRHIYFRHPGEGIRVPCSTSDIGLDIDLRGDGGYCIAPGS